MLVSCFTFSSTLKMEATLFSEKSADFQRTSRYYIPHDRSQVKVTLRLTVSQSVSLGVEPRLGLTIRYLLLFDSYGLVFVGSPLWRDDGSVFCICCWPLPAQSFSGPSPLGLTTIFYCLRFQISQASDRSPLYLYFLYDFQVWRLKSSFLVVSFHLLQIAIPSVVLDWC
jgi:hypothetical protein